MGSGFAYAPEAPGLVFTAASGIAANGSAFGFAAAPDGDQVGLVQAGPGVSAGSISQSVTGLMPGATYVVRFFAAGRPGSGANTIAVAFNGVPLAHFTPTSTAFVEMTTAGFNATAAGTLTFTGAAGGTDRTTAIDKVTLVLVSSGPQVADSSFESPDLGSNFSYRPTVPGVEFVNSSGIAGNGSAFGFAPAPDGDQVGLVQATPGSPAASLSQSVTGLVAGTSYVVRFFAAARPTYGANSIRISFNGAFIASVTPSSTDFAQVTTTPFIASGSSGTLTFTGDGGGSDRTTAIDRVTVVPGGPEVANPSFETPEAGTGVVYRPNIGGARFWYESGIAGNGSSMGFAAAPAGNQVAFLETPYSSNPAMVNLGVTGLVPGARYAFSFYLAQRPGFSISTLDVSGGGAYLGSFAPASTSFAQVYTSAFIAGNSPTALIFSSSRNVSPLTPKISAGLDMVRIFRAELVGNASFEDPDTGSLPMKFAYRPLASGASFANGTGVAGNGSAWRFAPAPDGKQVAFLQGMPGPAPTISQTVTGLVPGKRYKVIFWIAQRPGYGPNPVTVSFGWTPLGTFTPASTSFAQVTSAAFTAPASGILTFTGTTTNTDTSSAIDKVLLLPQ